ncbi:MAG: endonuclease V [Deltaproteobacteria bacterium]|nr:endonuclease V [Deltaproteobacteria bacterium]
MIVAVDVDYRVTEVVAACVGFRAWPDEIAALESITRTPGAPAPYEPGEFFRRELPYLQTALAALAIAPAVIVVDGYVWLGPERPGLGAHLHAAIGVPVVGVAKRHFAGATTAIEVRRGGSAQPLFVTAIGVDLDAAANHVQTMHGPHRLPTLLKRVDRLARDA